MGMNRPTGNVIFNTRKGGSLQVNRHDLNSVILPDPKSFKADEKREYWVNGQEETFSVGQYIKKIEELSSIKI